MSRVLRRSRDLVASAKATTAPAPPKAPTSEGGLVTPRVATRSTRGPATLPPSVRNFLGLPPELPTVAKSTDKVLRLLKLVRIQNPKNRKLIGLINLEGKLKEKLGRKSKTEVLEIAKIVSDFVSLKY